MIMHEVLSHSVRTLAVVSINKNNVICHLDSGILKLAHEEPTHTAQTHAVDVTAVWPRIPRCCSASNNDPGAPPSCYSVASTKTAGEGVNSPIRSLWTRHHIAICSVLHSPFLQMSQLMRSAARTVAGTRTIGFGESRQRTLPWASVKAQAKRDGSVPSPDPQVSAKPTYDASSPRTTMGALSKDETFMCECILPHVEVV